MSILRALLLVAAQLAPAWAGDVRAQQAFTVPYGAGDGAVGRESGEAVREYAGPSSLRVGPAGEVLVVDTIGHRVLRFAPGGALLGTVTLPAGNAHDAEVVAVDVAQDRARSVHVLELSDRAVLSFGADGKALAPLPVPVAPGGSAILNEVALDAAGELMVFDGFDSRVIRLPRQGKATALAPGLAQSLGIDAAGRFLYLDLPDPGSARTFTVWRVDAATARKEQPVAVTLAEPANELHMVGADAAGRLYVEVAFGAVENPRDRQVLVLSPAGHVLERIAVPPPPTAFHMVSARAVLPGGGLLTASDTSAGLAIRAHPLAAR